MSTQRHNVFRARHHTRLDMSMTHRQLHEPA